MSEENNSKKRLPRGTKPPKIALDEAVRATLEFYERAAGDASKDALAQVMGHSPSSSAFQMKVATMTNFNLIKQENGQVSLTEIGTSIVAPKTPNEKNLALKDAFLSIEIFESVYSNYSGKLLPQDEFLINSFIDYVPKKVAEKWMESFKVSAKFANLLIERSEGKYQVVTDVTNLNGREENLEKEKETEENTVLESPAQPIKVVSSTENQMPSSKSHYEFLIDILDADMEDEEKNAVWTLIRYLKEKEAGNR